MILQISILVFALVPSEAFIQQPKRSNFKHRDRDPASSMANLEETPSSSDTKNINLRMESGGDGKEKLSITWNLYLNSGSSKAPAIGALVDDLIYDSDQN